MVKLINIQDSIDKDFLFVDVRSEKEYSVDNIPGSINIPILDDEERHIVGYTYKQVNKDEAIKIGYDILNKKSEIFEEFIKNNLDRQVIIYCFRGGLRSASVALHLSKKNKNIHQLEGGYKSYRKYVEDSIKNIILPKMYVLNGYTGTGKTELLHKIENSIDLEDLAKHRSSAFGSVGLKPRTQKMFESQLLLELKKNRPYIVIEGESRKIGDIFIPNNIFNHMTNSKMILLNCLLETRAKRLINDYFTSEENIKQIENILPMLTKIIGVKKVEEYKELLDNKNYLEFCELILKEYYDPIYDKTLKNLDYSKIIDAENLNIAGLEVTNFCE